MKIRHYILVASALLLSWSLGAQESVPANEVFEFLSFPRGVARTGMAGAGSTLLSESSALATFDNPAVLAFALKHVDVAAVYSRWAPGSTNTLSSNIGGGASVRLGKGFALSAGVFSQTHSAQDFGSKYGSFTPRDLVIAFGAGASFGDYVSLGVSARLVQQSLMEDYKLSSTAITAMVQFHLNGFNSLMILDHEQCKPFDANRAGLNLGEGASYIVIETEESAKKREARILGRLSGYGNACDAFHQTASSDDGEGAYLAMRKALGMAGLSPADISYVNAHGTGTPNNDVSESQALFRVFGHQLPYVSSTKGLTGHTTSASGAVETAICLLSMHHHFVPANYGWHTAMENGVKPVDKNITNVELRHVMCNSFGFGGNDSSLIISQY